MGSNDLPPAPEGRALTEEEEREVERAQIRLILLPFAFPLWLRMRRERPELASRLRWAGWFNIAQSVVCVVVVLLAVAAAVAIPPLVAYWMSLVQN
jgi:hypothetical protein